MGLVAVTGGCGLLGRAAAEELRAAGHAVRLIDRPGAPAPARGAELADPAAARRALEGCDTVVHLAAWPSPLAAPPDSVWRDNVAIAGNVAFAADALGIRRFVYASSQSVLGLAWASSVVAPDYVPVDEEHPCRPSDAYSASKLAGEQVVAALARGGSFRAHALRFPVIWRYEDFAAHVAHRLGDPAQGAKSQWAYIDARDAARAVRLALEAPPATFEILNVCAPTVFETRRPKDLIRQWYPELDDLRIDADGFSGVFDWRRAEAALGFRARYRWTESGIVEVA